MTDEKRDDGPMSDITEGVARLRAHYSQPGRAGRVSTTTIVSQLDSLLAGNGVAVPEIEEPVHWSPRPVAGKLHDFPDGSPVTRVFPAVTCPTCRHELIVTGLA